MRVVEVIDENQPHAILPQAGKDFADQKALQQRPAARVAGVLFEMQRGTNALAIVPTREADLARLIEFLEVEQVAAREMSDDTLEAADVGCTSEQADAAVTPLPPAS